MNSRIRSIGSAVAVSLLALSLSSCSAASVEGTWGEDGEGLPQLVLEADGTLNGTDGCNRLMGAWTQDGSAVDFGQVATTMMLCEGVDTWLSALVTGEVDGDTLTILDIDGNEIGTLAKQ
ncbi:MAG: META domain-containing protein [Ruaniaceae bacterium]|nr:META domain-containing protein [Ruaniaceae bacterium]